MCRQEAPRDRLFAALQGELSPPAGFTVMVMEDLHWADEATIDLLSFLGRRLGRMPVLLLATYRDDELGAEHPLRVVVGDLATQRATRRMRLPPLSAAAVRALVGQRDVDAAELHRVTGGNPFYVTEMLAAGWPSVPPTVRDAVGARVARAAPAARRAVEAAAVIGARVDRALLTSVLAGSGSSADDCLATGIVVAERHDFRFRHELARMAVEAGVAPHRKRNLHARVLAALGERAVADPAVLAHHADGAGDAGAVLRHAPVAARRSSALGAHREAAAQFERALRFSGDSGKATLAFLHEGLAVSIRCSTGGTRPNRSCARRWRCGASSAMTCGLVRTCGCCLPHCGGCAGERSPSRQPRMPCGSLSPCRRAGSWCGHTRVLAPRDGTGGKPPTACLRFIRRATLASLCTCPISRATPRMRSG